MMKFIIIIVVLLILFGEISSEGISSVLSPTEISTEEISLVLSPTEHWSSPPQSEIEMSPPPKMFDDYIYPSSSQFPEAANRDSTDITGTRGENSTAGGGKKTGLVVGAVAAASMVGVGGYVLKKRRENLRRSRYEYAATEIF